VAIVDAIKYITHILPFTITVKKHITDNYLKTHLLMEKYLQGLQSIEEDQELLKRMLKIRSK
jgi:hypothetical protein